MLWPLYVSLSSTLSPRVGTAAADAVLTVIVVVSVVVAVDGPPRFRARVLLFWTRKWDCGP